jgi:hypothetical protein
MMRHQSPLLMDGVLGTSGHVATPNPSPDGGVLYATGHVAEPELPDTESKSGVVGTRDDTRALSCWVQNLTS